MDCHWKFGLVWVVPACSSARLRAQLFVLLVGAKKMVLVCVGWQDIRVPIGKLHVCVYVCYI